MTYIWIFIFKIIEDALSTLRLIVVSNGKKILGAILQLIVTIIWILLTGSILIDFMKDIYKIYAFTLGALCGSYIGSIIEEKIAIGTNSLIVSNEKIIPITQKLNNYQYIILNNHTIIIITPRKNKKNLIKTIKNIDKKALIIDQKITFSL